MLEYGELFVGEDPGVPYAKDAVGSLSLVESPYGKNKKAWRSEFFNLRNARLLLCRRLEDEDLDWSVGGEVAFGVSDALQDVVRARRVGGEWTSDMRFSVCQ